MTRSAAHVSDLLVLAGRGRPRPAIELADGLVADGLDPRRLVLDVLTTTQERIGELWLENSWSTAQEHAATAVVDGIVGALSTHQGAETGTSGVVVVACAEEEYHSLPARMGAELLRQDGWDVVFLGASVPAEDLQDYVADAEPDAVVVCCTIGTLLIGAARSLAAVREVGIPAIAVGAAFGPDATRARTLGATGWIDGSRMLTRAFLDSLPEPAAPFELSSEGARLEVELELIVHEAGAVLARALSLTDPSPEWHRQVHEDLRLTVRYLGVAAELDERAVFDDHLAWWRSFLDARGTTTDLLDLFVAVLAAELSSAGFARLAAVCTEAIPHPSGGASTSAKAIGATTSSWS